MRPGVANRAELSYFMADTDQDEKNDAPVFGTFRVPRSVYYAVYEPLAKSEQPPALLLAFHGYGQSANSFIQPLGPARKRNILVVAAQAPNQFYWQQGSNAVGFTWMTRYQRDNSMADNRVYLSELMRILRETYSFDPERIFALGFSQGVAMAFRFAESGAAKLRGLAAVCGDLPKDVEDQLHVLAPFPVLVMHGKDDSVVSLKKSEEAIAALSARNFPVESEFLEGGHELPDRGIERLFAWIEAESAE